MVEVNFDRCNVTNSATTSALGPVPHRISGALPLIEVRSPRRPSSDRHLPTPWLAYYSDDQVEARPHEAISATQVIIIHHSSFIIATSSSLVSLLTFKP